MEFFNRDAMNEEMFKGDAICHYEILKSEVDKNDFSQLDDFMSEICEYGVIARQKVLFSFLGYENDKREIVFIPEVLHFIKAFMKRYPFFWYYAIPNNSEYFYLAVFIQPNKSEVATIPFAQKFYVKQNADVVKHFIMSLAMNLNIYGEEIDDIEGAAECLKIWSAEIIK